MLFTDVEFQFHFSEIPQEDFQSKILEAFKSLRFKIK